MTRITSFGFALGVLSLILLSLTPVRSHDHSAAKADKQRREANAKAKAAAEVPNPQETGMTSQLTIRLQELNQPVSGMVRLVNLSTGKPLALSREIHRELNWYSIAATTTVSVPRTKVRVEAIHGLGTRLSQEEIDLTNKSEGSIDVNFSRFYDAKARGLSAGNTHLHLMKMSYLEALQYLEVVPRSDDLDLVFLSHLRRIPDEREYISNQIVENSFAGADLQRLSQHGVLFGTGEEHRHNFGRGDEGFGHVMLLDLKRLIHPVSIGPGIMAEGTDSQPLRIGIQSARGDGATAVWCHNTFGLEDIPNWAAGLLDAQNIYDGGAHGSYRDTYYRYLNLGWRIPFSTGTDWFIYDFNRVYVPVPGKLSSQSWLAALRAGKSYITNGPFLEFTVNGRTIGETIELDKAGAVAIKGHAAGRSDFHALELIHNGEVVRTGTSQRRDGHYSADLTANLEIDGPGWLALRTPVEAGKNELEKPLFAHTSPIYLQLAGKKIFRSDTATELIGEVEKSIAEIESKAKFANDSERESVLRVYRDGIAELRRQLSLHK